MGSPKKARKKGGGAGHRAVDSRRASAMPSAPTGMARLPPLEGKRFVQLFEEARYIEAEAAARRLIALSPAPGHGWKALGAALQKQGRLADALEAKLRSVELLPEDAEAYSNLGHLLLKLERPGEAEAVYRAALTLRRYAPEQLNDLGIALHKAGRLAEAEAHFRRALELRPGYADAYNNLGILLHGCNRLAEAEACYRKAFEFEPGHSNAWNNLGITLQRLDRLAEAEAAYRRAMELQTGFADACINLAGCLQKQARLVEAEALCRRALAFRPGYADAWSNLGLILQDRGRPPEAEVCFRKALESTPADSKIWNHLGVTLQKLYRLAEAEAALRRAIELDPGYADALSNLGGCLMAQARLAEAAGCFRGVGEIDPTDLESQTNLLFCLSHDLRTTPEALFAEHRRVGAKIEEPLRSGWRPHSNAPDAERTLKVGLVSGDFRVHAMAHYLEPLVESLALQPSLRLHAYATHLVDDRVTERVRAAMPQWTQVAGLSDDALTERIRADGIDILLDLAGYTGGHRATVFARKPAPIQCGWIGYLGTSGMECMNYYLADRLYLPPGEFDRFFTEKIVRLPAVANFRADASAPLPGPLPALANGHLSFGSFSRMAKFGPEAVALWSELMRRLPSARMLIAAMAGPAECMTVAGWFASQRITSDRLQFHLHLSAEEYLNLHHQVDICVDPFPFAGATTTCHAMWMGVPTLTLEGRTPPGRLGPALLRHVGLDSFVARDPHDFIEKGLRWARDLEALAELRLGLRERFRQSPLGRPADFASHLAEAFRCMWRTWCERPDANAGSGASNCRSFASPQDDDR